jgi:thiamine-monophosphate kinase
MPLGEFELIERFFRRPAEARRAMRGDVPLGIGDDAAVLSLPPGRELVAALDTLVEGRHFVRGSPPESIAHRALAVNLSDLAAMGAEPAWFLLSLTLPEADESFLERFARGLFNLAEQYGVALVGGDTTAGPLAVAVQALGSIEPGTALTRSGGSPGDLVYVSGTPGDAAGGLKLVLDAASGRHLDLVHRRWLSDRFHFPTPRVALGRALRGIASACVDVSDGLAADAGRMARFSGCGLAIDATRVPVSAALVAMAGDERNARRIALTGGEDCELCFTVPPDRVAALDALLDNVKCPVTCIGALTGDGRLWVGERGVALDIDASGYDHFART